MLLYLAESPGQLIELGRLATLLAAARPDLAQALLAFDCGPETGRLVRPFLEAGAVWLNGDGPTGTSAPRRFGPVEALRPLGRRLRDILRPLLLARRFRRLLRGRPVRLVVLAEDNVGARGRVLAAEAARRGLPVLICPYTIPNPDEAAVALGDRAAHQAHGLRGLVARALLRPEWIRRQGGRDLLRLPLPEALVLEAARLAPPRPWIANDGPGLVAVESPAMAAHYRRLGVARDRLVLTGSPADAALVAAHAARAEARARLASLHGLPPDRPLALCALPPDQTLDGRLPAPEFRDYPALVRHWAEAVRRLRPHYAVLVRPHPRCRSADLVLLGDLAVSLEDTAALVPLADLYVATISATIRWAVASAIPVVNYDVYHCRYDDYAGLAGVIEVSSAAAFADALERLAADPAFGARLGAAQAAVAADWGCLDGTSPERLVGLVDRLVGPC